MWLMNTVFICVLIVSVKSQSSAIRNVTDLDQLLREVFNNKCPIGEECVLNFNCADESQGSTDGAGLLDIRGEDETRECYDFGQKCCPTLEKTVTPIIPPSVIENQLEGCGNRYEHGVGFRVPSENHEAQYGEFPWMVSILKIDTVGSGPKTVTTYQCGGSLIHPKVILTAAHCVGNRKPDKLKIRVGEWDTLSENELFPPQDRDVIEIIKHPNFSSGSGHNDIALLVLTQPVEITATVQTACLPPHAHKFENSRCFVTGWGKNVYGASGQYAAILKRIDLPIVPNDKCERSLRSTRRGPEFNLHESFICAGGEIGKDACNGDGGSPLVCPISNGNHRYYQAGVVSWGVGCGQSGIPGVYGNVALFRNWIDQKFRDRNLNTNSYTV